MFDSIQFAFIHNNLTVISNRNAETIKGPWSRPCKIRTITVVPAAVAGTFEYSIVWKPIRGTSQMGTSREHSIYPILLPHNPHSLSLFPPLVHEKDIMLIKLAFYVEVIRKPYLECRRRLEEDLGNKNLAEAIADVPRVAKNNPQPETVRNRRLLLSFVSLSCFEFM